MVCRSESSRRNESTVGCCEPRFCTAERSWLALRMPETRCAFPAKETIVTMIQIKARQAMEANRMRRPKSPRVLLPLAPRAARSCKSTWLKTWLKKTRCTDLRDSLTPSIDVPVAQDVLAEESCALIKLVASGLKPPGAFCIAERVPIIV